MLAWFRRPKSLAAIAILLACTASQADSISDICDLLKKDSESGSFLYAKTTDTDIRLIERFHLEDIRGKLARFFYLVRGSQQLSATNRAGAVNIKVELWEADAEGNSIVWLYNNHNGQNNPCLMITFSEYQRFYLTGKFDRCLFSGFHNFGGSEADRKAYRRTLFTFPGYGWLGPLRWATRGEPAKRMSFIFNYRMPPDGSAVCVPFFMTTSAKLSGVRVVVDDLQGDTNIIWSR